MSGCQRLLLGDSRIAKALHRSLQSCLPLLVFFTNLSAEERIRTHQERFASPSVQYQLAEADATARLDKDPKDVAALTERGLARVSLGKIKAGVADFEAAVAVDRSSGRAWAYVAYGLWMQGQFEPALAAARQALANDPEQASAHWYTGRLLLLTNGNAQEARSHLERAVQLNPEEAGIRLDLLMVYRAMGDLGRAWAQLRPLRASLPASDTRLLYAEGLLASDLGRSSLAIDCFRKALAANPQMGEARTGLGIALVQAERWEEATDMLSTLSSEQPQSFRIAYTFALALQHTQRRAEAEQQARRALHLNPNSKEAAELLSRLIAHE
jgi:tetratricopeptide (TPR) repeat protein